MNIVNPSFEILEQGKGELGMMQHIERCGRTCYKSLDKITPESAKPFVENMISRRHLAMLEHGTVYLTFPFGVGAEKYRHNKYSVVVPGESEVYVTTNFRVLVENHWEEDLKFMVDPTHYHEKRYTVKYEASIHFYKDTTRHRVFSWAIESTRFCNYIKDKFGHSVSFAKPCWLKPEEEEEFTQDLKTIENLYFKWLGKGWQPQQAAYFLIQGTKAEIIMTGFAKDWIHFFDLRALCTTGPAHPSVQELAKPLMEEFIYRGYI